MHRGGGVRYVPPGGAAEIWTVRGIRGEQVLIRPWACCDGPRGAWGPRRDWEDCGHWRAVDPACLSLPWEAVGEMEL